ncbi:MAG: PAS domain-containing protein, partial [Nodosilinea sp.]
ILNTPEVWLSYIHRDDRAAVVQSFQSNDMAASFDQEYRLVLPDGTTRWARSRYWPLYDSTGTIYRLAGISEDITEQKQTNAALRENEQLLRLALAGAKAGSWDWNLQTNDVTWSPENHDLYGVSTANEVNWYRLWYNTIHPDDRERVRLDLLRAIEQRQVEFKIEFRIVHPQRGLRWLLGRGRFTLNERGEPTRLSGINLDITDRKQTEENLRQSEEFKNRLLESSPDCIKVLDIEGRLLYMNAGGMCILEIDDLTPYLNQEWICFWGEEFRHLAEQALAAAKAGEVSVFHGFCPTAKGIQKWWEVIVSPIRGVSGQTEQILSMSRDITGRRQAELRLRESEERLQLGMQVSGFALAQIDYRTNTVTLTPEAAAPYGLPTDQLTLSREQFHATFHPEDRAQLEHHIQAVLDPDGAGWFSQDHRILGHNGEVKWLTVRKQVFFDRSSSPPQPSHAVLVALDITDRKRAEMDRSRLLQQEQAARAAAERANRIKDEFLAVLSHELRSPLNPILGWTQLLQSRNLDAAKTATALATIERNAKLQTQLIDDLLDVAKILRGKLVTEMAAVDLAFAIESAIDTMSSAASAKSIRLNSVLPQIGRISGDSARLQQIVWNLLSNAIKFTPSNGQVEILLERVGTQAQITVSDTGKGINPEFLPYLFESFRQEDASTTRKYGGLGLGLAIVRSLVEAHEGTITADSPGEGQGSTFTVRFPLIDLEPEEQPSERLPVPDLDLTGVRVLAVDDEPDARELLAAVLTMYGADVLTVTSAAEVLTALTSFQPDILVSDIGMPDDDGYSLIQQIRALPPEQGGQIPAIALTAYAREEDYQRAIASGFQQQVTKPLEPERLVQVVVPLTRRLGVAELRDDSEAF